LLFLSTEGPEVSKEVTVLIGISWKGRAIAGIMNQPFYRLETAKPDSEAHYSGRCLWGIEGLGAFDSVNGKIKPAELNSQKTRIVTTRSHITDLIKKDLSSIPNSELIHAGGAGHKVLDALFKDNMCLLCFQVFVV
jgi:3'(2'), 5'-bisphosphate nucleotidase